MLQSHRVTAAHQSAFRVNSPQLIELVLERLNAVITLDCNARMRPYSSLSSTNANAIPGQDLTRFVVAVPRIASHLKQAGMMRFKPPIATRRFIAASEDQRKRLFRTRAVAAIHGGVRGSHGFDEHEAR